MRERSIQSEALYAMVTCLIGRGPCQTNTAVFNADRASFVLFLSFFLIVCYRSLTWVSRLTAVSALALLFVNACLLASFTLLPIHVLLLLPASRCCWFKIVLPPTPRPVTPPTDRIHTTPQHTNKNYRNRIHTSAIYLVPAIRLLLLPLPPIAGARAPIRLGGLLRRWRPLLRRGLVAGV